MTKCYITAFVAVSVSICGSALARNLPGAGESSRPSEISAWIGETGTASYYGAAHNGRRAADGSRFDQTALTAAHPWLPFGTKVRVTRDGTDRAVVVTITDRLYSKRRIVDLSLAAARRIGIIRQGLGAVTLRPV